MLRGFIEQMISILYHFSYDFQISHLNDLLCFTVIIIAQGTRFVNTFFQILIQKFWEGG